MLVSEEPRTPEVYWYKADRITVVPKLQELLGPRQLHNNDASQCVGINHLLPKHPQVKVCTRQTAMYSHDKKKVPLLSQDINYFAYLPNCPMSLKEVGNLVATPNTPGIKS